MRAGRRPPAALQNLASNKDIAAAVVAAGALSLLVRDGSEKSRANATLALGNFAAGNDIYKLVMVAAGALPLLVELLRSSSDVFQESAAGTMANHAACSAANRAAFVTVGADTPLEALLLGCGQKLHGRGAGESCTVVRHNMRSSTTYAIYATCDNTYWYTNNYV